MASTSSSSMANVLITPEDVLESLMNDGTIDAIRLKIITQLKANEELKNNIITMVEQSKVLNTPGAEKQTKRELFDSLRQELEIPALERASKSVWESILDNDGLGKEINETVEEVFCRLSGREPPLFPPHNAVQQVHVKDKENSRNENENEHLDSSSMNRNFSETSVRMDEGSVDPPSVAVDSVPNSSTVAADCRNNTEAKPKRCNRTDGKNWQCSKDCVPDQRYCERHMSKLKKSCERHMSKLKKPKSLAEGTNQDTSSKHVLRSERLMKRKKLVESTNQGALVNIMVDSSPNICSSMPSPSRVTNTDNNSSNHHRNNASPRLDPSPKSAVKGDSSRPQRLKKRKKPMEGTNQGALVNIMVDSSPNICSSMPSPSQVTNTENNSSSHHRNYASPRLDPSPKSAVKADSSRPRRLQKREKPVESTNQGALVDIMVDSSPNICSSMPSPSQVTNTDNNSSIHHRDNASPRLDPSPKSAVKSDSCERESSL